MYTFSKRSYISIWIIFTSNETARVLKTDQQFSFYDSAGGWLNAIFNESVQFFFRTQRCFSEFFRESSEIAPRRSTNNRYLACLANLHVQIPAVVGSQTALALCLVCISPSFRCETSLDTDRARCAVLCMLVCPEVQLNATTLLYMILNRN